MTTASVNIIADQDTNANLRAAGAAFNAQVAAMGMVQTSDTGQINWTTVARSAVGSTLLGYEMWRFNDALQATVPIFIRLNYRVGFQQANRWQIGVFVGFATDGAGNLTGAQKTLEQLIQGQTTLSTGLLGAVACLFSGSSSRIAFSLFHTTAVAADAMFCSIERTKDAAGADNGDGIILLCAAGGVSATVSTSPKLHQYLPFTGGVPLGQIKWPCILSNGPSAFGSKVLMGVPMPIAGEIKYPGLGALVYNTDDFSALTDHSMTLYGTTHTYKTLGESWKHVAGSGNDAAAATLITGDKSRIAMRFE